MEEENREVIAQVSETPAFSLKKGLWLNILLFVITLFSTFYVGINLSVNYLYPEVLAQNSQEGLNIDIFLDPQVLFLSFFYVAVLFGILLGHEFGHFLTCRYYKINATLPYFIPAPTLIGTMGAFIKIKSPITKKKQLFDIGIAGPLIGFILSIPALVYGLSLSKIAPPVIHEEASFFIFGEPLLMKIIGGMVLKDIPSDASIFLHPVAFAGWVGVLITSFNLFPVGQLDGGHVSYSLLGAKSRALSRFCLVAFVIMGAIFWIGWFIWALLISFLGMRHPRVMDEAIPLSPGRRFIGYVMILIFILSFIPDPIKGYSLFDVVRIFQF